MAQILRKSSSILADLTFKNGARVSICCQQTVVEKWLKIFVKKVIRSSKKKHKMMNEEKKNVFW